MADFGIARIGVVTALDWEASAFVAAGAGPTEPVVETTGPGPAAAAAGAERAVARGAEVLVSWGSAGALGRVEPGDIVLPPGIVDGQQHRFAADPGLVGILAHAFREIAPVHRRDMLSVDSPVTTTARKRRLVDVVGAVAVDMESFAIAEVAARNGLPLVIVRVIVDGPDHGVPPCAIAGMDGARTRPGRVLAGLLKSPREAPALLALALAARRARRTLAACAAVLPGALAQSARAADTRHDS